jgi:hypothetical protein
MTGLITPGQNAPDPSQQQPPTPGQPPGQGAQTQTQAPPMQQPTYPGTVPGSDNASTTDQSVNGADAGGPRAIGTVQDARNAMTANDPTQPMSVDPKEQAEFDQFVSRFTLILSDTGKKRPAHVHPSTLSPHDAILKYLNNPKVPLAVAIGTTTAQIAMMIVQQAQVSKVQYSPDVLFHACFECCALVYITGNASGIFKGVPPFRGLTSKGEYDFSDFEIRLICSAQMQAVRVFGTMELKAGMISPAMRQQNMQFWQQQVKREMASGMVNQNVLDKLSGSGVLSKKPSNSFAPGDGPQPVSAPAPPSPPPQAGSSTPPPQAAPDQGAQQGAPPSGAAPPSGPGLTGGAQ